MESMGNMDTSVAPTAKEVSNLLSLEERDFRDAEQEHKVCQAYEW